MPNKPNADELNLSDAALIESIKRHGFNRRSVMKVLGVGTAVSLGAGTASAGHDQPHPPQIDSHYGYAAPSDERLPKNLEPDHEVGLHIHENSLLDGDKTTMPFHFAPTGLKVEAGDLIRFNFDTPEHSVTAYHEGQGRQQRVPDEKPPFSSPLIRVGGFWLYEFDSPGTYDLFCGPHELLGMVMRIVVGDPDDDDYDGTFGPAGQPPNPRPPASRGELNALGVTNWPFPTPAEVLATQSLTVSNIASSESVPVSDIEADL